MMQSLHHNHPVHMLLPFQEILPFPLNLLLLFLYYMSPLLSSKPTLRFLLGSQSTCLCLFQPFTLCDLIHVLFPLPAFSCLVFQMLDADEALMKSATQKPRSLVKLCDTRWNVLFLVLRRFRALNPALRLKFEKLHQVSIDISKVPLLH